MDCGTCVEAEINLARQTSIEVGLIDQVLKRYLYGAIGRIGGTAHLADAVIGKRINDPEAREVIRREYEYGGRRID